MPTTTRRDFVRQTSLGALAISLASQVRGAPVAPGPLTLKTRELAPGEKFGIGIIGCGNRSIAHVAAINKTPQLEVRALCDILPAAMEQRRREVPGSPALYADYRALLADKRIDAVVIATPNDTHKDPTIAAFAADKHVLCEKPMALFPHECDAMIAAQTKAGRVLMIGTQRRHSPPLVEFVRRVHEGTIGTMLYAWMNDFRRDWRRMYSTEEEEIRKNWRYSNERSGGITFEMSIHGIDFCNWLMNSEPVEVVGMGGFHDPLLRKRESTDHAGLLVRYANGAQLSYGATLYSAGGHGPDVFSGTLGSAFMEGNTMKILRRDYGMVNPPANLVPNESIPLSGGNGNQEMHRHFAEAMQGKFKPTADGFEAKQGVQIARAAEISYVQKRYVRIAELT